MAYNARRAVPTEDVTARVPPQYPSFSVLSDSQTELDK